MFDETGGYASFPDRPIIAHVEIHATISNEDGTALVEDLVPFPDRDREPVHQG